MTVIDLHQLRLEAYRYSLPTKHIIYPRKLTWLENQPWMKMYLPFTKKNGDFPASHVSCVGFRVTSATKIPIPLSRSTGLKPSGSIVIVACLMSLAHTLQPQTTLPWGGFHGAEQWYLPGWWLVSSHIYFWGDMDPYGNHTFCDCNHTWLVLQVNMTFFNMF